MLKKMILAFLILLAALPNRANAELLTLEKAVAQARQLSPDIENLAAQTLALEAKASQAMTPSEPTLDFSYNDLNSLSQGLNGQASRVYSFTQPMLFPGKSLTIHSALL